VFIALDYLFHILISFTMFSTLIASVAPVCTSTNALHIVTGDKPENSNVEQFTQKKIRAYVDGRGKSRLIKNCSSIEGVHEYVKKWVSEHYARGDVSIGIEEAAVLIDLKDYRHGDSCAIRVMPEGVRADDRFESLYDELEGILPLSYGNKIGEVNFNYSTPSIPWNEIKTLSKVDCSNKNNFGCCALIEKTDGTKTYCTEPMRSIGTFCDRHGCEGWRTSKERHYCYKLVVIGKTRCLGCENEAYRK
jgi:hypothetical protein